jgi:Flp pilus assembly protein TadD
MEEQPQLDHEEVARLEALAEQNPADAEIRAEIGTLYMRGDHLQDAVRWFSESVRIDEDNLEVRNHLAISLAGLGRIDEAISEYRAALTVEPSHPATLLGLGRVLLLGKNDIRGGIEVWEKLAEDAPDSPEARSIRDELEALRSAHTVSQ